MGSGFRTKLIAAFIGFSLIPTVLLALVASGQRGRQLRAQGNVAGCCEALAAYEKALALARQEPERRFLAGRIAGLKK